MFIAQQVRVEHPRARGPAEPGHRLLLADRQAAVPRARRARPSRTSSPRRRGAAPRPRSSSSWPATTASRSPRSRARATRSRSPSRARWRCTSASSSPTLSYPEIGKQFNDKHHSTVMYSVREDREDARLPTPTSTAALQASSSTSRRASPAAASCSSQAPACLGKACGERSGALWSFCGFFARLRVFLRSPQQRSTGFCTAPRRNLKALAIEELDARFRRFRSAYCLLRLCYIQMSI